MFARDASLQDAGGFASPAGRRPARDKPYPRQNVHRRARTKRAGLVRRNNTGRAAGMRRRCNNTSSRAPNLRPPKTEPQDAAPAAQPPELPRPVRAPPDNPNRVRARPRPEQPSAAPPSADEAPAAWRPPERSCLHETRACRTQADLQVPRAGGPLETSHTHARTFTGEPARSGRVWCAGTTRVEPQGCGDAATTPQAAHPT